MNRLVFLLLPALLLSTIWVKSQPAKDSAWIRINQLGYERKGVKVAVLGSMHPAQPLRFELVDAKSGRVMYSALAGKDYGSYGPFRKTYRLDFSAFHRSGSYFLRTGKIVSPGFRIGDHVYDGAADFCLRYMRQQRNGFNPFLNDSCHKYDGYTLYGPLPDSTHLDVVGGWHDASDYLQYASTSANATYHLLAAYRDFRAVFADHTKSNGLEGTNGRADVLDEAVWGLQWLMKMHPRENWLFNQLGDDRDHKFMRIPTEDTNFYGRRFERPVYFCNGKPQQRGKYLNNTTGVASTAGKFAAAFALGSSMLSPADPAMAAILEKKAWSAYRMGLLQPGAAQTVSVLSPYIYAEDNWTDDMELGAASLYLHGHRSGQVSDTLLTRAYQFARAEENTPWLGADTARHYQWYPFINIGHYELAKSVTGFRKDSLIRFYREGIEKVWRRSNTNAFLRGIPFIWCSNNLTVSFAIQCYWYRRLSGDTTYRQLEQACFDWIFGCNPWGSSMVYGLPANGDTPADPHSAFTHLGGYPIDGGLVDGPVYASIYNNLIGKPCMKPMNMRPSRANWRYTTMIMAITAPMNPLWMVPHP